MWWNYNSMLSYGIREWNKDCKASLALHDLRDRAGLLDA
jgi:hypothetical protein